MTDTMGDLLSDMRRQVEYSDKVTMPIPLYERMKAVIAAMGTSGLLTSTGDGGVCGNKKNTACPEASTLSESLQDKEEWKPYWGEPTTGILQVFPGHPDADKIAQRDIAESSNGRKADFESVNTGSSPVSASGTLILTSPRT